MTTKLLLDTDIGSDIDDAVCLAYLLAQPKCELLGVTTVSGQPEVRARLVSALCRVAAKEVPIRAGASEPLRGRQLQPEVPQAEALSRWPHEADFERGEALSFLRETIHANPQEVVLLAIGPLTNVAQLFAADPEVPTLLRAVVMMGGSYAGGQDDIEWNIRCDPTAAAAVFAAPLPMLRAVGLDVTRQVRMEAGAVRERFRGELLGAVADFAQAWFERRPDLTFHDPLAAATVFDRNICRFEPGNVSVSEEEGPAGATSWQPAANNSRHQVAVGVDAVRFFDHFFSVFRAEPA